MPPPANTWVDAAIASPVTVAVGVLFLVLFGLQALFAVPIQLTPDIERPKVSVTTIWPGANPQEIEREIIDEQEDVLRSLEGLVTMSSDSSPSVGTLILEFRPGTELDTALLKVNNKLGEVPAYPSEAEKPILTSGGDREGAIGWFLLIPEEGRDDIVIDHLFEFTEDEIETRFERIPGIASANIFGGRQREILVEVDPKKMALRNITFSEVAQRLAEENKNTSAGHLDEGKRRYVIRTTGAFEGPENIGSVVIREDIRDRVFLRDIATVRTDYKDPEIVVRNMGTPCIAINVQKQVGSNVLEIMNELNAEIDSLNKGILADKGLKLIPSYDSSTYIRSALGLVQQNILLGGLLAIGVLFFFLRAAAPTVIIAVAIPVSAIGTFLAMYLLGRNINVVSLAGLSFAIGMLVDNSIVVLENIYRHAQEGKNRVEASSIGTTEVWGAVLASTLTTVAVFLPLLFMQAEIAQLLKDIALAICCAVLFSLVVSVFVIPTLTAQWMGSPDQLPEEDSERGHKGVLADFVYKLCGSTMARVLVVLGLTLASLLGAWKLTPPTAYLPKGNQNLFFCILIPPSGYNVAEFGKIADQVEAELSPMWTGPDATIESFFFVSFGTQVIMGAQAKDPTKVRELQGPMQAALSKIPGMIAFVIQASIFEQGLSGGDSIDLRLQGPDLEKVIGLAGRTFMAIQGPLKGAQVQPKPGLELGQPEIRIEPDRERLAEVGMTPQALGFAIDVIADGARVSEVRMKDGKEVDLTLRGLKSAVERTQDLADIPIYVPSGSIVKLGSLGKIVMTRGPDKILHTDRNRTVTLSISPPPGIPLQTAMEILEEKILAPMRADGSLDGGYKFQVAGTADKLTSTREEMSGQFLIALIVTYLLMASLFESFLYPLVILFTVPFAGFGGFLALFLVNLRVDQPLDVLTMLGFVLLLGIVVNNAILLVDRTLRNIREHQDPPREAVAEAVGSRTRPILMSTLTSVFGMAPLVFMVGPGSELYRGIGAVVVGGLLLATLFTLVMTPALLSLVLELRVALSSRSKI